MNKGLYLHCNDDAILWYETWENFSENSGATICFQIPDWKFRLYRWENIEIQGALIGAACLAQW